ncbi:MAG: YCF48-related protein [Blastocatellia bacterium]|nr:YCF48-related protein [Blastocatellia bacterium]
MTKSLRLLLILTLFGSVPVVRVIGDDDGSSTTNSKGEVHRWEITGPWGGDVRTLVQSPDDADILYASTSDGQIYRSTNGALGWKRLKPGLDTRGISIDNIVIDPHRPRILYAGAWAMGNNIKDQGVYKSTDGGEHWKQLKGTEGFSVLAIAVARSNSDIVIAGARTGVYRSTDGGDHWERISPADNPELRNINSAAIDPQNPDIIYIGTNHLPWKTTDGGATWKQNGYKQVGMLDDSDIMGIDVDPTNPAMVYMNACSGIYRSVTRGEKWEKLPGMPFSARRTYALEPHPTNPKIIFAGTSEGLWRSKDGGRRWMLLTSKSVVVRSIIIHPDKPERVVMATDDFGIQISHDLGDTFTETNAGFIHRHILAILAEANERGRILASVYHDGSAGSVFVSSDGGETWRPSSRGLGTRDVFAFYQLPDNPQVIYAGTNNGVYRSNDRGENWSFVEKEKPKPAKKPTRRTRRKRRGSVLIPTELLPTNRVGRYETIAVAQRRSTKKKTTPKKKPAPTPKEPEPAGPPLFELTNQVDDIMGLIDPEGRRWLIAATMDGLYRTADETKGWEKIYINGYNASGRVFTISTHKDRPGKIFAGTEEGLFISDNAGDSWTGVTRGPNGMNVKAIAQDPRDPDLVIVGTNHFVYRSTNGGRSWIRRGAGLPAGDFTSVVINPSNPDEVMVGDYSRGGVYRSSDKGYSWERIDGDLPTSRVWTLMFDPFERDRIYAGSFSSGVYVLTIQRGVATSSQ